MAHFMVLMFLTHQFNLNLPTSAKTEILFSIIRLCLFSSLFLLEASFVFVLIQINL